MLKRNMGRLDRSLRIIAAAVLAPIGWLVLGGWQGIVAVAVAALLLVTGVTGVCPGYVPLGISTIGRRRHTTEGYTA